MSKLQRQSLNLIVYKTIGKTIGSMQITLAGNLPFHGQSRKHGNIDKVSHSNSFCILKLHASSIFSFSYQQDVFRWKRNDNQFELPHGCTKPKRMTLGQKMANLELNIEFVIRVESFTLEETNKLCTRIWLGGVASQLAHAWNCATVP